jgi:hypothetical protein
MHCALIEGFIFVMLSPDEKAARTEAKRFKLFIPGSRLFEADIDADGGVDEYLKLAKVFVASERHKALRVRTIRKGADPRWPVFRVLGAKE